MGDCGLSRYIAMGPNMQQIVEGCMATTQFIADSLDNTVSDVPP